MISPLGQLVQECRSLIKELKNIELLFIQCSANMVAYLLARASFSHPKQVFDGGDVPIHIKNVLLSDSS